MLRYIDKVLNGQDIYREGSSDYEVLEYGISPNNIGGFGIYEWSKNSNYAGTKNVVKANAPSFALCKGDLYKAGVTSPFTTYPPSEVGNTIWKKVKTFEALRRTYTVDFTPDSENYTLNSDKEIKVQFDRTSSGFKITIKDHNDNVITDVFEVSNYNAGKEDLNITTNYKFYLNGVRVPDADVSIDSYTISDRLLNGLIYPDLIDTLYFTLQLKRVYTGTTLTNNDWLDIDMLITRIS